MYSSYILIIMYIITIIKLSYQVAIIIMMYTRTGIFVSWI